MRWRAILVEDGQTVRLRRERLPQLQLDSSALCNRLGTFHDCRCAMKFQFTRRHNHTPVSCGDPTSTDRAGRSLLHYAVIRDPVGLDYTAALNDPAIAAENFRIGNAFRIENTDRLLAEGADPNATDNDGFTPLHFASQRDSVDVVNTLIRAQADVNAVTEDKQTPLYNALLNTTPARYAIAEALLSAGADPQVDPATASRIYRRIKISGDDEMNSLLAKYGRGPDPTLGSTQGRVQPE